MKEPKAMSKTTNIGIVGTQFMGRAHSNAWMDVDKYYDLQARPVMKAACDFLGYEWRW